MTEKAPSRPAAQVIRNSSPSLCPLRSAADHIRTEYFTDNSDRGYDQARFEAAYKRLVLPGVEREEQNKKDNRVVKAANRDKAAAWSDRTTLLVRFALSCRYFIADPYMHR